jgi:tetratricopeptide (TPR) repeat protein
VIEAARGDLESAEKHLQKVLLINPEFALARKNLGDVYLALALECYEKSAPAFSRNKDVQQRLRSLRRLNGVEDESAE